LDEQALNSSIEDVNQEDEIDSENQTQQILSSQIQSIPSSQVKKKSTLSVTFSPHSKKNPQGTRVLIYESLNFF
jgi:hypothetical protein